jgi:hypothetical protein
MNPTIIAKYRDVVWYFAVYEGIELISLYKMEAETLEPYFSKWEKKWKEDGNKDINNPKIPLKFVEENGESIYESQRVASVLPIAPPVKSKLQDIEEAEE